MGRRGRRSPPRGETEDAPPPSPRGQTKMCASDRSHEAGTSRCAPSTKKRTPPPAPRTSI